MSEFPAQCRTYLHDAMQQRQVGTARSRKPKVYLTGLGTCIQAVLADQREQGVAMSRHHTRFAAGAHCRTELLIVATLLYGLAPLAWSAPGDTEVISLNMAGHPEVAYSPDISADGRYVTFMSPSAGFVANDTNGAYDVFVRDRQTGVTERVSVSSSGKQGNGDSIGFWAARITPGGRFVLFQSEATNLVANDWNLSEDGFVHDRQTGVTELVTVAPSGQLSDFGGVACGISTDGRFVAMVLAGNNIGVGDTFWQVFVRDRQARTTRLISVSSAGVLANAMSRECDISADGRYVGFGSAASNLVPNDTNDASDVFMRDRQTGVTERVSLGVDGEQLANGGQRPSISADGRFVAFEEYAFSATGLLVRDRWTGTTQLANVASNGELPNAKAREPAISADGRYVVFGTRATNLLPGDTNKTDDIFRRDLVAKVTEIESIGYDGKPANAYSFHPRISGDGQLVVFGSSATNLVAGVTTRGPYAFLHEAGAGGLGQVAFTIRPTSLAFGPQVLLTSSTLTFRLRNTSTQTLTLASPSRIFLRGTDVADFKLANGCGPTLAAGAACTLNVTFRPTSIGNKTASLRVIIQGTGRTRNITGTGVAPSP